MRAEIIKYPMGALTAEGALIYDENVSGKRPALLMAPNWMGPSRKMSFFRIAWFRITWFRITSGREVPTGGAMANAAQRPCLAAGRSLRLIRKIVTEPLCRLRPALGRDNISHHLFVGPFATCHVGNIPGHL